MTFIASFTENENSIKSIFMMKASYCIEPEQLVLSLSVRGLLLWYQRREDS